MKNNAFFSSKIKFTKKLKGILEQENYSKKGISYLEKLMNKKEKTPCKFKIDSYIMPLAALLFIIYFTLKHFDTHQSSLYIFATILSLLIMPIWDAFGRNFLLKSIDGYPILNRGNAIIFLSLHIKSICIIKLSSLILIVISLAITNWFFLILFIIFSCIGASIGDNEIETKEAFFINEINDKAKS